MKTILKDAAIKSAKSLVDLAIRLALLLAILVPIIICKAPLLKNIGGRDIFTSSTGFYIPELLLGSLSISLKLIFCSLIISCYFGLIAAMVGAFRREYYWLPQLLVIVSTIPVFITAYYLPYILFLGLILLIMLNFSSGKPVVSIGLLAVPAVFLMLTIAYVSRTGHFDIMLQAKPGYMPHAIWKNLHLVIQSSILGTEKIMPWAIFTLIGIIFLIYYRKYPLNSSLITSLFLGALAVYAVIIYGYRTKIENAYLLAPILTLAIGNLVLGLFVNQIQEGIAEQLKFDYIKAAAARGAPVWNHLRKKVLLIVLHTVRSQFALLLSLTVMVEKIYNLEGIGYLAWEYATQESDFVTVAWIVIMCFLLVWIFNVIIDACCFLIYPYESN